MNYESFILLPGLWVARLVPWNYWSVREFPCLRVDFRMVAALIKIGAGCYVDVKPPLLRIASSVAVSPFLRL